MHGKAIIMLLGLEVKICKNSYVNLYGCWAIIYTLSCCPDEVIE